MTQIEWVSIPPGAVEMGSNNRSVLFGNLGPRHIFTINSPFEISKYPVESDLAREVLAQDEAHVASESEWEQQCQLEQSLGNWYNRGACRLCDKLVGKTLRWKAIHPGKSDKDKKRIVEERSNQEIDEAHRINRRFSKETRQENFELR